MTNQKTIAVIGLGLLGGSLGLALKGKVRRVGWARRRETLDLALKLDAVDEVEQDPVKVLERCDIAVLALPIPVIIDFLPLCARHCPKHAVVTDIGSIKGRILQAAGSVFTDPQGPFFVGSHPMAGTEKSKLDAAFASLYDNADVFVVPSGNAPESAVGEITALWSSLCCRCSILDAEQHDILVANTSHVLHVAASALSNSILGGKDPREQALRFQGCATGFKDTSRIASSNPAMWKEIIENNREAVLAALDSFEKELALFHQMILEERFDAFEERFAEGKCLRDQWLEYKKFPR